MESVHWLAPIIVPLPKGRGLRRGRSGNLAGRASTFPLLSFQPPPIPWGCRRCWQLQGGHGSGYLAGTCSTQQAKGRVLPSFGGEQRHPSITGANEGEMDFDPNVLALRPGHQSPGQMPKPPLRRDLTWDDPGMEGRREHRPGPGEVQASSLEGASPGRSVGVGRPGMRGPAPTPAPALLLGEGACASARALRGRSGFGARK